MRNATRQRMGWFILLGSTAVAVVLVSGSAFADTGLEWGILRQGNYNTHFNDVEWSPSGNRIVAVGDDGVILVSVDGGENWQRRRLRHHRRSTVGGVAG